MKTRNILIVFFATFLYTTLRYNVFGATPVSDIPTLIVNKAIAFSMIVLLLLAFIKGFSKKAEVYWGYLKIFKLFAIIHVLISLALLSQKYYPKLFTDEKLTIFGNISILAGVLAFALIINKSYKIKNTVLYLLLVAHLFFIGFKGWFDFAKWNGMMPPITLICFLIIVILAIFSTIRTVNEK